MNMKEHVLSKDQFIFFDDNIKSCHYNSRHRQRNVKINTDFLKKYPSKFYCDICTPYIIINNFSIQSAVIQNRKKNNILCFKGLFCEKKNIFENVILKTVHNKSKNRILTIFLRDL